MRFLALKKTFVYCNLMSIKYRHIDEIETHIDSILRFDKMCSSGPTPRDPSEWEYASGIVQACIKDNVIGSVAWNLMDGVWEGFRDPSEDFAEQWGNIMDVAVDPRYRRRGIAKRMIHEAITRMKSRKIWQFSLQVKTNNSAAINLYQSLGFEIVRKLDDYYDDGDGEDDAFLMTRVSSRIKHKKQRPAKPTYDSKRVGDTMFHVYPVSWFGKQRYTWKIGYDDDGVIAVSDYGIYWNSARGAYLAGMDHFKTHRDDLVRGATRRKSEI